MSSVEAYQLPLFEEESSPASMMESIQGVTWSYTRRSALERCARRYYYEYFGANKTTAKREPDKDILHFLKNRVKSRYLLAGDVLHVVIRAYFLHAKEGNVWNADQIVGFGQKVFGKSLAYSQAHPDGKVDTDEQYPPTLLEEYYYERPRAAEFCRVEQSRLIAALGCFASDGTCKPFRESGTIPSSLVEHKMNLENFPCTVTGRIDLAYRIDEKVTVVDWKLGGGGGTGDNSLQLAAYGLWAIEYFNCQPDALIICEVHLPTAEVIDFSANARSLDSARARIIQDAERMLALQRYGKEAVVEAFTRCQKPRVCNTCVFRRVCDA